MYTFFRTQKQYILLRNLNMVVLIFGNAKKIDQNISATNVRLTWSVLFP